MRQLHVSLVYFVTAFMNKKATVAKKYVFIDSSENKFSKLENILNMVKIVYSRALFDRCRVSYVSK